MTAAAISPRKTIASVDRALRLLLVVADAPDGITAKAIARRLGANLSTTYHLLHTLTERGFLIRLPESRGYGIGYGAIDLHHGLTRQLSVTPEIAEIVHQVHDEAQAAACLAVFREGQIVIAHVVDSPAHPMPKPLDIGFSDAPHATAFGKVMLAHLSPRERACMLTSCATRITAKTICDPEALERHLGTVRVSGVALELEEYQLDLACLAVPVRRRDGTVTAAIAVGTGPRALLDRRWAIERVVRRAAHRASREFATATGMPAS